MCYWLLFAIHAIQNSHMQLAKIDHMISQYDWQCHNCALSSIMHNLYVLLRMARFAKVQED